MSQNLDSLFYPKTIAVVGASTRREWIWSNGNAWIAGSIRQGFSGSIYPVHPTAKSIMGYTAYPRIQDIPDDIDLAIFTIPLRGVMDVMADCVKKKVKFVHMLTAGFGETGRQDMADMETQIVQLARAGGIRLIGPNCMGLYCPAGGLAWSIDFPKRPGSLGFFSQSGQLAYETSVHFLPLAPRFSKVVSFGNACDLQAHDFLAYLAQDEETRVIGGYLEGLKDGRSFFETARAVTPRKPVVIWKGGQTDGGSRATRSHTAAIAGSRQIWNVMCRQTGIIPADDMDEMVYTLQALEMMPLPKGCRVAILGGAGGGSVTMTDLAEKGGLQVPHLSDPSIQRLGEFIPAEGSSTRNPLDIMPSLFNFDNILRVMEVLRDDPHIDNVLFHLNPAWVNKDLGRTAVYMFLEKILEGAQILEKPFYFNIARRDEPQVGFVRSEMLDWLSARSMAAFPDFAMAARILTRLDRYRRFLEKI